MIKETGKGGGETLASSLETELLGQIPMTVPKDNGELPSILETSTQLYSHYEQLAAKVDEKLHEKQKVQ